MINTIRSKLYLVFALAICIPEVVAQEPDFALVGPSRATVWQNPVQNVNTMLYGPTPADAIAYALADIGGQLTLADEAS